MIAVKDDLKIVGFSDEEILKMIELLKIYNKGEYLYKQVFIRSLGFSKKRTDKAFNTLIKSNFITVYYEPYCYNCNTRFGDMHLKKEDCISQIEDVLEVCGNENCDLKLESRAIYKIKRKL